MRSSGCVATAAMAPAAPPNQKGYLTLLAAGEGVEDESEDDGDEGNDGDEDDEDDEDEEDIRFAESVVGYVCIGVPVVKSG